MVANNNINDDAVLQSALAVVTTDNNAYAAQRQRDAQLAAQQREAERLTQVAEHNFNERAELDRTKDRILHQVLLGEKSQLVGMSVPGTGEAVSRKTLILASYSVWTKHAQGQSYEAEQTWFNHLNPHPRHDKNGHLILNAQQAEFQRLQRSFDNIATTPERRAILQGIIFDLAHTSESNINKAALGFAGDGTSHQEYTFRDHDHWSLLPIGDAHISIDTKSDNKLRVATTTPAKDSPATTQSSQASHPPSSKNTQEASATAPHKSSGHDPSIVKVNFTKDHPGVVAAISEEAKFGINNAQLSDQDKAALDKMAADFKTALQTDGNLKFQVVGHADTTGNAQDNLNLSQRRADAAVEYLKTKHQIDPKNLAAIGVGSTDLANPNDGTAAENRRNSYFFVKADAAVVRPDTLTPAIDHHSRSGLRAFHAKHAPQGAERTATPAPSDTRIVAADLSSKAPQQRMMSPTGMG